MVLGIYRKNFKPYWTKLRKGCPWQDESLWKTLSFHKNDEDSTREVFLEHVSDHFECSISGNKEFFRNYIHFSSELSSSKTFTLLDLTISAQRETICLLRREMVQPCFSYGSHDLYSVI